MKICRWRKKAKTGAHTLRVNGIRTRVLPGGILEGPENLLSASVRDDYELVAVLQGGDEEEAKQKEEDVSPRFELRQRSGGFYDVINSNNPDKPINSKALRKAKAESLLASLTGQEKSSDEESSDSSNIDEMDWDELVVVMNEKGLEITEAMESADDLREAIRSAS